MARSTWTRGLPGSWRFASCRTCAACVLSLAFRIGFRPLDIHQDRDAVFGVGSVSAKLDFARRAAVHIPQMRPVPGAFARPRPRPSPPPFCRALRPLPDLVLKLVRFGRVIRDQVLEFAGIALQVVELGMWRQDKLPAIRAHGAQLRPSHVGPRVKRLTVRIIRPHVGSLLDQGPEADTLRFGRRAGGAGNPSPLDGGRWSAPGRR